MHQLIDHALSSPAIATQLDTIAGHTVPGVGTTLAESASGLHTRVSC